MTDLRRMLEVVDPSTLTTEDRRALLVVALKAALAGDWEESKPTKPEPTAAPDRLLTADQVAVHFGRSVDWVYRKAARDPAWKAFTRRVGRRTTRFSETGLRRYLARRAP